MGVKQLLLWRNYFQKSNKLHEQSAGLLFVNCEDWHKFSVVIYRRDSCDVMRFVALQQMWLR